VCSEKLITTPKGQKDETKFGLTIDQRITIIDEPDFNGSAGSVWAFGSTLITVYLDKVPDGKEPGYKFFYPGQVQKM